MIKNPRIDVTMLIKLKGEHIEVTQSKTTKDSNGCTRRVGALQVSSSGLLAFYVSFLAF